MSVSRTISKIFSVKEWRDLETNVGVVQGHWKWCRSINQRTFYWSAIVSIALSGTVFDLLDIE